MHARKSGPLRIIHVVDSLEFGGLERVVTDLSLAQQAQGNDVTVLSILQTSGFAQELRAAGIKVIVAGKLNSWDVRVLRTLLQAFRDVDLIHAHNFMPAYYAAASLLFMCKKPTFVGTLHDMGTRLSNQKLRTLMRWSLSRMQGVSMVGQQVYDRYINEGLVSAAKSVSVLNGIPVERFRNTPERRTEARLRLGLNNEQTVVGCVGRLVPLKNHSLLLDSVHKLIAAHPNLMIVIVGYGELEESLQQQARSLGIESHVLLTGKRADVADLLPAFDIFALPSQTEGLSIALLEACASGLAVVASAVGGNPEIVHDNHTGILVPANDQPALTGAIDRLLSQPELRSRLGKAACSWVANNASSEALRSAYDQFYREASAR